MAKIMVIDRNSLQSDNLTDLFKLAPHEILVAHSPEEASEAFKTEKIYLIFLNIIPEQDTKSLIKAVKKAVDDVLKRKVPIVAFTKSFSDDSFLLDREDVAILLEHPVRPEQLTQIVEQYAGCNVD